MITHDYDFIDFLNYPNGKDKKSWLKNVGIKSFKDIPYTYEELIKTLGVKDPEHAKIVCYDPYIYSKYTDIYIAISYKNIIALRFYITIDNKLNITVNPEKYYTVWNNNTATQPISPNNILSYMIYDDNVLNILWEKYQGNIYDYLDILNPHIRAIYNTFFAVEKFYTSDEFNTVIYKITKKPYTVDKSPSFHYLKPCICPFDKLINASINFKTAFPDKSFSYEDLMIIYYSLFNYTKQFKISDLPEQKLYQSPCIFNTDNISYDKIQDFVNYYNKIKNNHIFTEFLEEVNKEYYTLKQELIKTLVDKYGIETHMLNESYNPDKHNQSMFTGIDIPENFQDMFRYDNSY